MGVCGVQKACCFPSALVLVSRFDEAFGILDTTVVVGEKLDMSNRNA